MHLPILDTTNGKQYDFERSITFIQPERPIAKKRKDNKDTQEVDMLDTEGNGLGGSLKSRHGTTGVELRSHKYRDFQNLNKNQQNDLKEW